MKYHFKGVFQPRHSTVQSPKKRTLKETLSYDGSLMDQIRQNLESVKYLIQKRYGKR